MNRKTADVAIVGAGPAGSTAAIYLNRAGASVILVDKDRFPRPKPCGDAVCGKSIPILRELSLIHRIEASVQRTATGEVFANSAGNGVRIPFSGPGYVIKREIFDEILFREAQRGSNVETFEEVACE